MNVSQLANQLKMTPNELLDMLPRIGFHIGRRAIKVPDSQVDKITIAILRHRKLEQLKSREESITEIRTKGKHPEKKRDIELPETIVVKDLSEKLSLPIPADSFLAVYWDKASFPRFLEKKRKLFF